MQIVVDGLMTTYERIGQGKTVLLLHGWGDKGASLKDLQRALAVDYQVIAPDLPGFGGTQSPPAAWGLDSYARFVADFLNKLGIKDVYAIIAHSNGGAIAIRALSKDTIGANKLVLLASAGLRNVYKGRRKSLRVITKAGKALTSPLPKSVKNKLRQKVYKTIGSDMLVAEHLQETFRQVVTDDIQRDAAELNLPTLLIYGENDTATPVWFGEKLHELIDTSTLEILPDAGHFVHLDRPYEVTKAIREFL